jgi:hypothetical protein
MERTKQILERSDFGDKRFWRERDFERWRSSFNFDLDDFELLKINFNLLNVVISNGVRKIK